MKNEELCPCQSGKGYGECCGPLHSGARKAATAEALMRARYAAYAVKAIDFLKSSGGPKVQEEFDEAATKSWAEKAVWEGLEILSTEGGGEKDSEGVVEFIAHYSSEEQKVEHHERAIFQRLGGEWKFIDGVMQGVQPYRREQPKIGRNDPCPCGSGKKYKKCCGKGV